MPCAEGDTHFIIEVIFGTQYMLYSVYFSFGEVYISASRHISKAYIIVAGLKTYILRKGEFAVKAHAVVK